MSLSKSQFQSLNGKRSNFQRMQPESSIHNQHDDLIKYIYDSWNTVSREFEQLNQNGTSDRNSKSGPCVLYYVEQNPNPQLKDFQPFDLEAFWGQRVVQTFQRNQS